MTVARGPASHILVVLCRASKISRVSGNGKFLGIRCHGWLQCYFPMFSNIRTGSYHCSWEDFEASRLSGINVKR